MKKSLQTALNQFFENEDKTMSQQALSKARSKFYHSPFVKLFTVIRDAFYAEEHLANLRRYCGKLIIAIDGSETLFLQTFLILRNPSLRNCISKDDLSRLNLTS